ncbi:diacylglycerol kinase family enzyme [Scopulibacillus darangshiensis]|uniref:Diacylglycerol kinase family enzyme n=1 Tax=Scopulibacillus darangshiensis TaxID=442528 RepID=A0A4R2P3B1_9BACL|nr:diacylglycerol kinase family protein [Scopulibacillus darangshiensis]TCP29269.1 diacylglycerol kinase family enzyme [Scopulibacillus darangshiensis]
MKTVSVIINLNADGQMIKQDDIDRIDTILSSAFETVAFYEAKLKSECTGLARRLAKDSDVLIAMGGDSTVYEIINTIAILKHRPVFSIIPGGKCNGFSKALGLSRQPIKAAEQIAKKNIRSFDVGHDGTEYFINLLDFKNPDEHGPFHYELSSKHYYFSGKAESVLVANNPYACEGLPLLRDVDLQDGLLDVYILRESKYDSSLLNTGLTSIFSDDIIHFQTPDLAIQTSPSYIPDRDRERLHRPPANIHIKPGYLKVLAG